MFVRIACVLICVTVLAGCVKRLAVVNSEPSGARVYFDGDYHGETPAEIPFKWYGGHRITLEKDGYERVSEVVEIDAPVHMTVPVDFLTELAPYRFKDRHEFQYTLTPADPGQNPVDTPQEGTGG